MERLIVLVFLTIAGAGLAMAGNVDIPEIGAGSAAGALSLLTGAMLVLRSRRRKQAAR
jgi:hypothetical protein